MSVSSAEYRIGRLLVTEDGRFVLRRRKPRVWKRVPPVARVSTDALVFTIRRVAPGPVRVYERGSDDFANARDRTGGD